MTWYYEGKEFIREDYPEAFGFVYLIENLENNRKYIGKKFFTVAGYKQVNKKRKRIRKPSDWPEYYGSSPELLADVEKLGKDKFSREILRLCKSKTECAYYELREQIDRRVLESDEYYNSWIQVKVQKRNLT